MGEMFGIINEIDAVALIALLVFSAFAGFLDAVVGGGGLIQLPALLINLPNVQLPTLFGTNKIAALSGTTVAAVQYSRKVKFDFRLLVWVAFWAFVASYFGAKAVTLINVDTLKPIVLVLLVMMLIYTIFKKDLGAVQTKSLAFKSQLILGSLIGIFVGFYDGFLGPGTGSFFVLGFVVLLGFEFITASAYSKVVNCMTNISALLVFIRGGHFLLEIGLMMAVCNIIGNFVGSNMALKKGNQFVRWVFIIIVTVMIFRYAYEIFFK